MKMWRKGLLFLALMMGIGSIPTIAFALPGEISYYSGTFLFTRYTGLETFSGSLWTYHSPVRYMNNEVRIKMHFDKYRYNFRSSGSTTFNFAIAKISAQYPDGVTMYEQQLNSYSSYNNYLDGDYYIYMYDYSGTNTNLNASTLEVSAVSPGIVSLYGPGSFNYNTQTNFNNTYYNSSSSYLLLGETYTIEAFVEGAPTSVVATITTSGGTSTLGTLTYNSSLGRYTLPYTFNTHYDSRSAQKPTLKVTATYPNSIKGVSTASDSKTIYVTEMNRAYYLQNDSTWYYNSPTDNSFIGGATNPFTCYSFVTEISDASYTGSPQQGNFADIKAFMMKTGAYAGRPGIAYASSSETPIAFPDAIYYQGFHFARVRAWDASGNPTVIESKWGGLELIRSTNGAPFSAPGAGYGVPRIWFKK
ncbi:hypothetical protein [Cohnella yongneupensis]|uniref:Uncharacterized protein n=1 Tax=Cohnella yongneupensis TaxID=425006 RepID=A0ABW0R0Q5_9BACL